MIVIPGKYTEATIMTDAVEPSALEQIIKLVNNPAFEGDKIVIMPDVHAGAGVPIGTTILKRNDRIIPNVVGVDIGCGVAAYELSSSLADKILVLGWDEVDKKIRAVVPTGFSIHNASVISEGEREKLSFYKDLDGVCKSLDIDPGRVFRSIGTLGGGNHFIEFGMGQKRKAVFLIIHSGSRNFGLRIAKYYQEKAKRSLEEKYGSDASRYSGLEWLEGEAAENYLRDQRAAVNFAETNRTGIALLIINALSGEGKTPRITATGEIRTIVKSGHNYVETYGSRLIPGTIIRKGAICADKRDGIVIPLNMRDGALIATGSGNKEWNFSAPHGAGRVLSRSAAKKKLSLEEFRDTMREVASTSVCENTLDESPMAYKDPAFIEEAIKPTCTIDDHIKPLYNMKDCGGKD